MPAKRRDRLSQLEECRYRFGRGEQKRVIKLLNSVASARFSDARSLMRFHETLLFLRAFPQGPAVVRKTEKLLNSFSKRVAELRQNGLDRRSRRLRSSARRAVSRRRRSRARMQSENGMIGG